MHRFCAFSDTPIFATQHCDLEPVNSSSEIADVSKGCPCSNLSDRRSSQFSSRSESSSASSSISLRSSLSSYAPKADSSFSTPKLPFSSHTSARICFKSALHIAQSFRGLPYPNVGTLAPTSLSNASNFSISLPNSSEQFLSTNAPRTMPSFACCAMQSSYAMLMLCHRTREINGISRRDIVKLPQTASLAPDLLEQLSNGVRLVLEALDNYSIAFEALDGMRRKHAYPCTL